MKVAAATNTPTDIGPPARGAACHSLVIQALDQAQLYCGDRLRMWATRTRICEHKVLLEENETRSEMRYETRICKHRIYHYKNTRTSACTLQEKRTAVILQEKRAAGALPGITGPTEVTARPPSPHPHYH